MKARKLTPRNAAKFMLEEYGYVIIGYRPEYAKGVATGETTESCFGEDVGIFLKLKSKSNRDAWTEQRRVVRKRFGVTEKPRVTPKGSVFFKAVAVSE